MKAVTYLLKVAFVVAGLSLSSAGWAQAESTIESEASEPKIVVQGSTVTVLNASGLTLEIYDVTGTRKGVYKIESTEKTWTLSLPKGLYIFKTGKVVRKFSLR